MLQFVCVYVYEREREFIKDAYNYTNMYLNSSSHLSLSQVTSVLGVFLYLFLLGEIDESPGCFSDNLIFTGYMEGIVTKDLWGS